MRKQIILGIIIGIIILIAIVLFASITTVPTGYVGVKTRFGEVQDDVIQEGLNTKVPFIEKIVKIDCRTKKAELESNSASKDLQDVSLKIAVNYNVNKDSANKLYQEVGVDYEQIIVQPAILESIKAVTAQYTAEQLITNRQEVSNLMQDTLKGKLEGKGFNLVDLSITDLNFSDAYNKAIEEKQVAQQNAQKAEYELEQAKIDNEKKIENAKTEAEVMELQNKQITENTLRLKALETQQKAIEKWNGQLPTTTSDAIPFLNINN